MLIGHAFGARYDLPVPLLYFVVGGAAVVLLTFLLIAGRDPRPSPPAFPDGAGTVRPAAGAAAVALVLPAFLVYCGLTGSQEVAENLLPTAFWLIIWIAVPISCAVIGDWTPWLNPAAALARLADRPGLRRALMGGPPLPWPQALGWWPAVAAFVLVASGELVYNQWATRPAVTAWALMVYGLVSALGGLLFGAEAWLSRGEVFSVLFDTWGRLGRYRFGRPGPRRRLGGLDQTLDGSVSRITFVLLMLMSVTFDGLLATPYWKRMELQLPPRFSVGSLRYIAVAEAAFVVLILLSWLVFGGFAAVVAAAGRLEGRTVDLLAVLLPSLVPISFGYLLAHNFDYLLVNGQLLIPLVGNPTGRWQWLPAPFDDSYVVHRQPVPAVAIWYFQVVLIVAVHVVAVVVAHRHVRERAGDRVRARRSEWPWTGAMVAYTMTSLWLLAQPIAKGG